AVWVLILLGALAVGRVMTGHWAWLAAMAGVLLSAILPFIVTGRGRHGRGYRRLSIVPYARMQFVDVTAGPLERAFKLATVQLHTAAAATDAKIPRLPPA